MHYGAYSANRVRESANLLLESMTRSTTVHRAILVVEQGGVTALRHCHNNEDSMSRPKKAWAWAGSGVFYYFKLGDCG